jgi:hypothetical protein
MDAHVAMAEKLEDLVQKDLGWTPGVRDKPLTIWTGEAPVSGVPAPVPSASFQTPVKTSLR